MSKKLIFTTIVILLVFLLVLTFKSGIKLFTISTNPTPTATKYSIKVAWSSFPSAIVLAEEKGFFQQEGIEIEKQNLPNLNLTIEALSRGDIELASINYTTLFSFQNSNPDKFKILYGSIETEDHPYTLLISKESINTPTDLIGKKVAIRSGIHSEIEAKAVLKNMGLDISKVDLVVGERDFLITALTTPNISAVMAPETYATTILEKKIGKVLVKSPRATYIFSPYPTAAGVVSSKFASENPELVKRIKTALDKAIDFMNTNEPETRLIFEKSFELEHEVAQKMNLGLNSKLEQIDKSSIEKLIDFQVQGGLLDKKPDLNNVYFTY